MKRTIIATVAAFAVSTLAIAGNYPPVPYTNAPIDTIQSGINTLAANVNTYGTGMLFSQAATSATSTGTAEQTLGTYSLPASFLNTNGQSIRIKAWFKYAANTNSKTPKLYFGASSITGTANTTSGNTAALECLVTRSGASTQNIACAGVDQVTNLANAFTAGTDTDTGAIVIKATCTDGTSSAGDCTLQNFIVESLR